MKVPSNPPDPSTLGILWRNIAIVGVFLLTLGIVVGFVDLATTFRFRFLMLVYIPSFVVGVAGIVVTSIGLIGWAAQPGKRIRNQIACLVVAVPSVALFLEGQFDGLTVHGPSMYVLFLMLPAIILTIILFSMAAYKHKHP